MLNNDIDSIKRNFGIKDGKSATNQQFETLMDKVAIGEISKEQVMLLLNALPNLVELQKTYIDGIKTIADSAKEMQKNVIDNISKSGDIESSIAVINKLLDNAETEELKFKILDALVKITIFKLEIEREKAKRLQEVNQSNNSFWKKIGVAAASVASVAVAIAFKMKR